MPEQQLQSLHEHLGHCQASTPQLDMPEQHLRSRSWGTQIVQLECGSMCWALLYEGQHGAPLGHLMPLQVRRGRWVGRCSSCCFTQRQSSAH